MIFLDIETIPTQNETIRKKIADEIKPPATIKKAETLAKWEAEEKQSAIDEVIAKTGLDGAYGQIACISYAFDDGEIISACGKDEANILVEFFGDLALYDTVRKNKIQFCGHNLSAFDLRFIFHRAVVNNIQPPNIFPINAKSWDDNIFDTMTYWAGHGNRVSLDKLCTALGIEGKSTDFTWEDVLPAYLNGDFDSIAKYCESDVDKTRQVYKRLTFSWRVI